MQAAFLQLHSEAENCYKKHIQNLCMLLNLPENMV
jgi:hypothetical protein